MRVLPSANAIPNPTTTPYPTPWLNAGSTWTIVSQRSEECRQGCGEADTVTTSGYCLPTEECYQSSRAVVKRSTRAPKPMQTGCARDVIYLLPHTRGVADLALVIDGKSGDMTARKLSC